MRVVKTIRPSMVTMVNGQSPTINMGHQVSGVYAKESGPEAKAFFYIPQSVPVDAELVSAHIKASTVLRQGTSHEYNLDRVVDYWKEFGPGSITYANQPAVAGDPVTITLDADDPVDWDITSVLAGILSGDPYTGFVFYVSAGDPGPGYVTLSVPTIRLELEYAVAPDAPRDVVPNGGAVSTAYPAIQWHSNDQADYQMQIFQEDALCHNRRIKVEVDATGGTFNVDDGTDNVDIGATNTAEDVQAQLETLGTIGAGNVLVYGGPGDDGATTPYFFELIGDLEGSPGPALTFDGTNLTGGASTVVDTDLFPGANVDTGWVTSPYSIANSYSGSYDDEVDLYSRVRVRNTDGQVSPWSPVSRFQIFSLGTLNILNPVQDYWIDELPLTTILPNFTHEFTGRTQESVQYLFYELDEEANVWRLLYDSSRVVTTGLTYTPTRDLSLPIFSDPEKFYMERLLVWDDIIRVKALNAQEYAEAIRIFKIGPPAEEDPQPAPIEDLEIIEDPVFTIVQFRRNNNVAEAANWAGFAPVVDGKYERVLASSPPVIAYPEAHGPKVFMIWLGASGGNWNIAQTGGDDSDFAWDDDIATIQAGLEAFTGIGAGNVEVTEAPAFFGGPSTLQRTLKVRYIGAKLGDDADDLTATDVDLVDSFISGYPDDSYWIYQYTFQGLKPQDDHVLSIENLNGYIDPGIVTSRDNPTVESGGRAVNNAWLIGDDGTRVAIIGQNHVESEVWDDGAVLKPEGRRDPVQVTSVIGGLQGSVEGALTDYLGVTRKEYEARLLALKAKAATGEVRLRLVWTEQNIEVIIGSLSPFKFNSKKGWTDVGFEWTQIGDFFFDGIKTRDA